MQWKLSKAHIDRGVHAFVKYFLALSIGLSLGIILAYLTEPGLYRVQRITPVSEPPKPLMIPAAPARLAPWPRIKVTYACPPEPAHPDCPQPTPIPAAKPPTPPKPVDATRETKQRSATARRLQCITPRMRAMWERVVAQFGPMEVISTCDHSYYVAGTTHMSHHVTGDAIDFTPPADRRREILAWLVANHHDGLTMTYGPSSHIHIDIGHHGVILAAADKTGQTWTNPAVHASARARGHHVRWVRQDDDDDDF